LAASTTRGEAGVRLEFCVACGSKDGLQHGYLVAKKKGGSDAEPNRITLCTSCNDKLHEQRYGSNKHSQRIKTAMAARRARGANIGRPRKLLPDECKEALRRLDGGESKAVVARSYGLSKSTVSRMVRSAPPTSGPESSGARD
jgi:Helix-turn-helix domain of resolvase/HNH endonuclease